LAKRHVLHNHEIDLENVEIVDTKVATKTFS